MRFSTWLERLLIVIGCGCLVAVGTSLVRAASFQKTAAQAFERELMTPASAELAGEAIAPAMPMVHGLIGRLEIPRLDVSVMVMEGDDDTTLARAVGHLPDTALPWDRGNAVIAGHRDTFFRPLKDVREGDDIRLTTTRGTFDYRVIRTAIVEPDDLSVLAPTPLRSLTLVTCYPFYYVGSAPQRFIIHAREAQTDSRTRTFTDLDIRAVDSSNTVRVTTSGESDPVWSRDGRELFYIDHEGLIATVPVRLMGTGLGQPRQLIARGEAGSNQAAFDVEGSGRFLMRPYDDDNRVDDWSLLNVIQNWPKLIRR